MFGVLINQVAVLDEPMQTNNFEKRGDKVETHSRKAQVLFILQVHSVNPLSDGMLRPINRLSASLAPNLDLLLIGDGFNSAGAPRLPKPMEFYAPPPFKNPAVDFVAGFLGRNRKLRQKVASISSAYPVRIVSLRASWLLPQRAILLKSDLFSLNYRRRALFALKRMPMRLLAEIIKLMLSLVQEMIERITYDQILLHSALEQVSIRKARYFPIITEAIKAIDANQEALRSRRVLVVGYQFDDPIANADTDAILAGVLRETNDTSRIFYLGRNTTLLSKLQQTDWVEDYDRFIQQFAVAVYARSVCSGAHNKVIDLLKNGCVVYCASVIKAAFITPCKFLVDLDRYKHNVDSAESAESRREDFCGEVNRFFLREAEIYREVLESIGRV